MWLIESETLAKLSAAIKAGITPTAEQQAEFTARSFSSDDGDMPRILTIAGDSAQITIQGLMTNSTDLFSMLFGGGNVTYPEIIAALAQVKADESVKNLTMEIESGGGEFDGLFDTIAAMQALGKPITVIGRNIVASAAFALAAQGDKIVAANRATRFGSIGVAASFQIDENEVEIASTDAPKKRPDVTTAEGVAIVRELIDPMHDLFVESIASGRKTTVEKVNAEFGQGGMLLSAEALERGMIDSIQGVKLSAVKKPISTNEAKAMDLEKLKAEHPGVYAAVVAIGAKQGVKGERDRVTAHLTLGESSGDMKTAMAAVADGSELTATLTATYMAAGMNRKAVAERLDDEADTGKPADPTDADKARDEKASEQLLQLVANDNNVKLEA